MPDELPRGDKAIYVFLEMIALAFVFAAVERLFGGKPWQVVAALVAALVFFIAGIAWSRIKAWIGLYWAVASIGLLTLIILGSIGYDIYDRHRRVTQVSAPPPSKLPAPPTSAPAATLKPIPNPPLSVPWDLSKTQETELLSLLHRPCETIADLKLYMKNMNPNVMVIFQDPHDPGEYKLGSTIGKLMHNAGCGNVAVNSARIEDYGFVQSFEPFFGIEVWNGYNGKTREAAALLQEALVKVRPDTRILPGGQEPEGGHFEGIAVLIGKLTR